MSYQQDTSCALQLLHGCVEITVSHMGEFINTTMDEETLETSHTGLDHGLEFKLEEYFIDAQVLVQNSRTVIV